MPITRLSSTLDSKKMASRRAARSFIKKGQKLAKGAFPKARSSYANMAKLSKSC